MRRLTIQTAMFVLVILSPCGRIDDKMKSWLQSATAVNLITSHLAEINCLGYIVGRD